MRRLAPFALLLLAALAWGILPTLAQDTGGTPAPTEEADPACEAPLSLGPEYFIGLGDAYFASREYTNAILAYDCAIQADGTYAPAYARRGYGYTVQRAYDEALADYEQALALDEGLVAVYNNRGVLYMQQGNFGLAINDFTLAVTLAPDDPTGFNNRGIAYAAEGSYDLALADLQTAIDLDPTNPVPHASLGAVYTALATTSYQEYRVLAGGSLEGALPRRRPADIIQAVEEDGQIRDFEVWLPFILPAN